MKIDPNIKIPDIYLPFFSDKPRFKENTSPIPDEVDKEYWEVDDDDDYTGDHGLMMDN